MQPMVGYFAMAHQFLSSAWLDEVRSIRDEYADLAAGLPTPPVRANLVVTDVPFGERTLHAHAATADGELDIELGHLPDADITVTLGYRLARSIVVDQKPEEVAKAWLMGKIKVSGDLTKLLPTMDPSELVAAANEARSSNGRAAEVGARIRAATA